MEVPSPVPSVFYGVYFTGATDYDSLVDTYTLEDYYYYYDRYYRS